MKKTTITPATTGDDDNEAAAELTDADEGCYPKANVRPRCTYSFNASTRGFPNSDGQSYDGKRKSKYHWRGRAHFITETPHANVMLH